MTDLTEQFWRGFYQQLRQYLPIQSEAEDSPIIIGSLVKGAQRSKWNIRPLRKIKYFTGCCFLTHFQLNIKIFFQAFSYPIKKGREQRYGAHRGICLKTLP